MALYNSVRIASSPDGVEEWIKKYSDEYRLMPPVIEHLKRYGIPLNEDGNKFCVLIYDCMHIEPEDYNIIIGVIGPGKKRAEGIMQEIQEKTGIKTKPAPDDVKKKFDAATAMLEERDIEELFECSG